MNYKKEELYAVILAGGNSKRMGAHKSLIQYDGTKTFYEHIAEQFLQFGCKRVIVSLNHNALKRVKFLKKETENIQFVENRFPDKGRFYSLQLAVNELPTGSLTFLHNTDNPFIESSDLEILMQSLKNNSTCVLEYNNRGGHPILLSPEVVEKGKSMPESTDFRDFLKDFNRINCKTTNDKIRVNINTLVDYKKFGFPF